LLNDVLSGIVARVAKFKPLGAKKLAAYGVEEDSKGLKCGQTLVDLS
jgi:hypothetical protein